MKRTLSFILSLILLTSCLSVLIALPASAVTALGSESDVEEITVICDTDKDPIYYNSGERVTFTITLLGDGSPVTVPELRYTFKGDDGTNESGKITPDSQGKYILEKTCMDIPGYMSLTLDAYGSDGKKWKEPLNDKQSYLFLGGILVNAFAIEAVSEEPEDFDQFWADSLALLDDYPAELVGLKELPDKGNQKQYEVYINCYGRTEDTKTGDTFVAGYLSIPKNADPGTLKIQVNYQGQGLSKISAYGGSDRIMFNCLAHSVNLSDLAAFADTGDKSDAYAEFLNLADDDTSNWGTPTYGMSPTVGADREKVYYRQMLLRDYQAIEFLIKYFSADSKATEYDGIDISSWAGLWDGQNITVQGGSQGGFQAIGVAALHKSVTELSASIPWLCDIGAGTTKVPTGTRIASGNRPVYASGYDYVDSIFLAKRVTCKTTISAGLGDPTCPPSGTMAMFNNLVQGKNIDATMELKQGRTHGFTPENNYISVVTGQFSAVTGWSLENGVLTVNGTGTLDTSLPQVAEWNENISTVKEIHISGGFTHIADDVFELKAPADVYINCQLDFDARAFGGQDVNIYVPGGIDIEGATSLGFLGQKGNFYYLTEETTLVIKSANSNAILDFSELDIDFRSFVSSRKDTITAVEIRGKFAAIGKLKSIFETLSACKSVKIDVKTDTLTSEQNFNRMEALETLGHWDFDENKAVSYTDGIVDLTGFTKLLEEENSSFELPEGMLEGCKAIKKVILPAELIRGETSVSGRISKSFFKGCTALEEIILPETVTLQSIAYGALKGCKSLKSFVINGTTSPSLSIEFDYVGVTCFDDIPEDCKFLCADYDSVDRLNEMFEDAGVGVTAATIDGSVRPDVPAGSTSDDAQPPVLLIAAIAGGVAIIAAVVVLIVVLKKKKK